MEMIRRTLSTAFGFDVPTATRRAAIAMGLEAQHPGMDHHTVTVARAFRDAGIRFEVVFHGMEARREGFILYVDRAVNDLVSDWIENVGAREFPLERWLVLMTCGAEAA